MRLAHLLNKSNFRCRNSNMSKSFKSNKLLLFQRLWDDTLKQSTASLYHPFVIQIAQGSLDKKKFREYMQQDEYFLNVYNKCLNLGLSKCKEDESELISLLKNLKGGIKEEVELHNGVLSGSKEIINLNSAAKAYTDNLVRVATFEPELGPLIAALLPCPLLYKYIGDEIAVESKFKNGDFDTDLSKWIAMYSSNESDSTIKSLERLLEKSCSGLSYQKLLHYYRQSMVLEYMFFDSYDVSPDVSLPYCQRNPKRNIVLMVDFDMTMTKNNTIDVIGEGAVKNRERQSKSSNHMHEWQMVRESYVNGFKETVMKMDQASSLNEMSALSNEFEWKACKVLSETKFIGGMSRKFIESLANFIEIREGCSELLNLGFKASNLNVNIVSANWSSELIKSVLRTQLDLAYPEKIDVYSNSLIFDENDISTGVVHGYICGPDDKKVKVEEFKQRNDLTIFIGDSLVDLQALLVSDVGIIIGEDMLLRKICDKGGIILQPLVSLIIDPDCQSKSDKKILFTAESFYDIIAFVHGIEKDDLVYSVNPDKIEPRVLAVGGSDSGCCSGIQSDLKTCEAHGVFSNCAVTSVTAQNTIGVYSTQTISSEVLDQQIYSCLKDFGTNVIKTGMLPSVEAVASVSKVMRRFSIPNLVVDPVFRSSTGTNLVSDEARKLTIDKLFPLATIVTPNIPEIELILGGTNVRNVEDMKKAAVEISKLGPSWVLVKGGHLPLANDLIVDILYDKINERYYEFSGPVIKSKNYRGTGCILASAIASNLALGKEIRQSVADARSYVQKILENSVHLDISKGNGPLIHSYDHVKQTCLSDQLSLYLVTDRKMIEDRGCRTAKCVEQSILGGASFVQIRCKNSDAVQFMEDVKETLAVCRKHNVPLVVNDRIDVAVACGADGVHIGQTDINIKDAKKLLGPNKIIGVSARNVQEAILAESQGASYIGAGAIYATPTKSDTGRPIGIDTLEEIVNAVKIPVVAIGGINSNNASGVIETGCAGVAVVSAILKAQSVDDSSKELSRIVLNGKRNHDGTLKPSEISTVPETCKGIHVNLDVEEMLEKYSEPEFLDLIKGYLQKGLTSFVLRTKHMDGSPFCQLINKIKEMANGCGVGAVSLYVSDRVDIASVSGACGVFLDEGSMDIADARRVLPPGKLIAVRVGSLEEAKLSKFLGANLIFLNYSVIRDKDQQNISELSNLVLCTGDAEAAKFILSSGFANIALEPHTIEPSALAILLENIHRLFDDNSN